MPGPGSLLALDGGGAGRGGARGAFPAGATGRGRGLRGVGVAKGGAQRLVEGAANGEAARGV